MQGQQFRELLRLQIALPDPKVVLSGVREAFKPTAMLPQTPYGRVLRDGRVIPLKADVRREGKGAFRELNGDLVIRHALRVLSPSPACQFKKRIRGTVTPAIRARSSTFRQNLTYRVSGEVLHLQLLVAVQV